MRSSAKADEFQTLVPAAFSLSMIDESSCRLLLLLLLVLSELFHPCLSQCSSSHTTVRVVLRDWDPTGLQIEPDERGLNAAASPWSSDEWAAPASDETFCAAGDKSF